MGLHIIAATASSPWYTDSATWVAILMVAAGLGFVIFVHELGHFLAAKFCGVRVDKFYVGFDVPIKIGPLKLPSSLAKFQWGETEYGIGILPLGGYVKMFGQDDDPRKQAGENERSKVIKSGEAAEGSVAGQSVEKSNDQDVEFDPRSYKAKTVPQRMLIISAGVIMNLITGVLFAACAFHSGVPYTPCEIGAAVPGGPAWHAGLRNGDRIVQLGKNAKVNDHLRFDWDLRQDVVLNGGKKPLDILIRRDDGKEEWVEIRPTAVTVAGEKALPSIGIIPPHTLIFDSKEPKEKCGPSKPEGFLGEDKIVAINGVLVADYQELARELILQCDKELVVEVERPVFTGKKQTGTTKAEVKVPTSAMKRSGIVSEMSPIVSIQKGSPADVAGLQVGDVLVALADEPIADPLLLIAQCRAYYDREVTLKIRRGTGDSSQEISIPVTPRLPLSFGMAPIHQPGIPLAEDSLGICFYVTKSVRSVIPESPAAKAGIQAGDVIRTIKIVDKTGKKRSREILFGGEAVEIDNEILTWLYAEEILPRLEDDFKMMVTYQRGTTESTVELTTEKTTQNEFERNFRLKTKSEIRRSESLGEGVTLGLRQTKEDAQRVAGMMQRLVTGQVSPTNLGGPMSIAAVAGTEAMRGFPRFLIFLTFLSANLAVLNFMPIPALDGGHMMFLLWEGLFRKPVNERVQIGLTLAGVACLLCLMIFVFGLDIQRFFF